MSKRLTSVTHSLVFNASSTIHQAIMLLYEMPKSEERDLLIKKLGVVSDDLCNIIDDSNLFTDNLDK